MRCVSPPELEERELLALIAGDADPSVAAHVERCAYCRAKWNRLGQLHNALTARLFRIDCPSPERLGEYHLDLLSPAEGAAIRSHLAACPHCQREVAQLREYLGALAPQVERGPLERVRVLIARLIGGAGESFGMGGTVMSPAPLAVRGESEGPSIYRAGAIEIVLQIQEDVTQPDRKAVLGLITGMTDANPEVQVWRADERIATAPVDKLGNFVIAPLEAGTYDLVVRGAGTEVHLNQLDVTSE